MLIYFKKLNCVSYKNKWLLVLSEADARQIYDCCYQ